VAVASAGPYAGLHLIPDNDANQHPTAQFSTGRMPSCHPTNSVKALKEYPLQPVEFLIQFS